MISLDQALRMHTLGLSLIPLGPRTKKPDWSLLPKDAAGEAVWAPYQTTRPTETELREWFGNGVQRNAGVVLGAVSGVVVIETDSLEAETWCAKYLPPTPMMTRSARGVHRYYRMPTGRWAGVAIPPQFVVGTMRIEIKREGHYTVAPGSVHPGDSRYGIPPGHIYSEIGSWPSTLDSVPEFPMEGLRSDNSGTDPQRERGAELPKSIEEGGRNNLLFQEGCRLRRLRWDEAEILAALKVLNAKRCHPPLSDRELETIAGSAAHYEPAQDVYPTTDTGNAEYFASVSGDMVRFDHGRRAWFVFDGHHWVLDRTEEVDRLALQAIRGRQAAALKEEDTDTRKRRQKWAIKSESRGGRSNLTELAAKLDKLAVSGDDWDTNPWLLGVQNGVVDLRTGELRGGLAVDHITKIAPLPYDALAACPRWDRFLNEIFQANEELPAYIQRVFGYALTGITTEQVFWILWGEGANGKSTLIETFMNGTLGPAYSWTMPFPTATWTQSMSEYQKASLVGQRFVAASEVSRRGQLNEELVKSLTGNDTINARHPYGRPFQFIPAAKIFLRVNERPVIHDQSHGMWRRVKLIPFTQTFAVDTGLATTLAAEAPGILAWAVRGCLEWQRNGLAHPSVVESATEDYRDESDEISEFIADRCQVGAEFSVGAKALFDSYRSWCDVRHVPTLDRLSQKGFGMRIRKRFEPVDGRTVTYRGVGLLAHQEERELWRADEQM